jgi:hypothetical protein
MGVEFLATDGKSDSTERMWTKRVQKPRRYSRYICALLAKVGSFCRLPECYSAYIPAFGATRSRYV